MSSYKYQPNEVQREILKAEGFELKTTVPEILEGMASTFRERNAIYKDNYKRVSAIINLFWHEGVPPMLANTNEWHLFHMVLSKLCRFAASNLEHIDSIHDCGVFSAMIEEVLINKDKE